ncbi:MAG: hypothetical protein Q7S96_01945 [bacterium]|nr:hypothetical protein [bacterium]
MSLISAVLVFLAFAMSSHVPTGLLARGDTCRSVCVPEDVPCDEFDVSDASAHTTMQRRHAAPAVSIAPPQTERPEWIHVEPEPLCTTFVCETLGSSRTCLVNRHFGIFLPLPFGRTPDAALVAYLSHPDTKTRWHRNRLATSLGHCEHLTTFFLPLDLVTTSLHRDLARMYPIPPFIPHALDEW